MLELNSGKLYLLSGPPGSGKSTLVKNSNLEGFVISSDEVRKTLLGTKQILDEYGTNNYINGWDIKNREIFDLIEQMLRIRLSEGLTTILDFKLIDDNIRKEYVQIASEYNVEAVVLLMPQLTDSELFKRNSDRSHRVSKDTLMLENKKYQYDSKFSFFKLENDQLLSLVINNDNIIKDNKIDVFGDIHGMYSDFISMVNKLGYTLSDNELTHPNNRKLLLLGDFLDRGQESLEMIRFAMMAKKNGHYVIIGNHEQKVINFFDKIEKDTLQNSKGFAPKNSYSNMETCVSIMKLDTEDRKEIISFLKSLPYYYVNNDSKKVAFIHADTNYFHPLFSPKNMCVYGLNKYGDKRDSDAEYDSNYKIGNQEYMLIRGHIEQTSSVDNVFSLEYRQAFAGGKIVSLKFDDFLSKINQGILNKDAYNTSLLSMDTNFDFGVHMSEKINLMSKLKKLVEEKLCVVKEAEDYSGLSIYKYSKKVFFKSLWNSSEYLLKARGIVLDSVGSIVQHPFDKIFNYGENGAGLSLSADESVIVVDKMNGFLGCIGKHPYKKDVLVTTSGSFASDYVDMIKEFINPRLKYQLIDYLSKNPQTLMFEVIHANDPHIVKYSKEECGLYLIGARGLDYDSPHKTENELDSIASELGFKRVSWSVKKLSDVKSLMKTDRTEGFILRENTLEQKPLLKMKTNYYLTTKFIARMNKGNIALMYANPNKFKEGIDEEFYNIVDHIVSTVTKDNYSLMTDIEKTDYINSYINNIDLINKKDKRQFGY